MLSTAQELDLTALLSGAIMEKEGRFAPCWHPKRIGSLFVATFDVLLAHGAELNTPTQAQGRAVLHSLCELYRSSASRSLDAREEPCGCVLKQREQLISPLRSRGADISIVIEGKTALDELLEGIKEEQSISGAGHSWSIFSIYYSLQGNVNPDK